MNTIYKLERYTNSMGADLKDIITERGQLMDRLKYLDTKQEALTK